MRWSTCLIVAVIHEYDAGRSARLGERNSGPKSSSSTAGMHVRYVGRPERQMTSPIRSFAPLHSHAPDCEFEASCKAARTENGLSCCQIGIIRRISKVAIFEVL